MKRDLYCRDIFCDSDEEWSEKAKVLLDTYRLKNTVMQSHALDGFIELIHSCTVEDRADFILERYWIWDKRVEYEWSSERIKYFRKLHIEVTRVFPKPHIK